MTPTVYCQDYISNDYLSVYVLDLPNHLQSLIVSRSIVSPHSSSVSSVLAGHGVAPCAMFCDGQHVGQITAAKDVSHTWPLDESYNEHLCFD